MHKDISSFKQSDHGILFQNSDGNINLGVWFNDPDVEMNDIIWYNILATDIFTSVLYDEGLISTNAEFETASCYAELHR